jgi:hypothetical protein
MYLPSRDLPETRSSLSYIKFSPKYETEKPYYYSGPLEPGEEGLRSNVEYETHDHIPICNLRGQEQHLSVEENGFELKCLPFHADSNALKEGREELEAYINALSSWMKERFDAEIVLCYDYRVHMPSHQTGVPLSITPLSFEAAC